MVLKFNRLLRKVVPSQLYGDTTQMLNVPEQEDAFDFVELLRGTYRYQYLCPIKVCRIVRRNFGSQEVLANSSCATTFFGFPGPGASPPATLFNNSVTNGWA